MLMCLRFPGLAPVYDTILGFDGSEFYTEVWEEFTGMPFGDLQCRLPDAVPIGVHHENGTVTLNPQAHYIMEPDDGLIVLAVDNDTYKPEEPYELSSEVISTPARVPQREPEMILFAGWRADIRDMINLLDSLVAPGSQLHILCTIKVKERNKQLLDGGFDPSALRNLRVVHLYGSPAVIRHLEQLPIDLYSACLVLSDGDVNVMQSDSACLATLVLVRTLQLNKMMESKRKCPNDDGREGRRKDRLKKHLRESSLGNFDGLNLFVAKSGTILGEEASHSLTVSPTSSPEIKGVTDVAEYMEENGDLWSNADMLQVMPMVCEVLDPRTQQTIQTNERFASISDFLKSNDMVSKVLAMVGEDLVVKAILNELLLPNRSQIEVVLPSHYIPCDRKFSFFDLSRIIHQHHKATLIGYFDMNSQTDSGHHIPYINPENKSAERLWTRRTMLIIICDSLPLFDGDVTERANQKTKHTGKMGMPEEDETKFKEELCTALLESTQKTLDSVLEVTEGLADNFARAMTVKERLVHTLVGEDYQASSDPDTGR